MLAARVCRHASKQEEGEAVSDLILTLNDALCKVVLAGNAGTLVRGVAKAVQGTGVGSVHDQQFHLHALPRQRSDVEGGGATFGVHVVGVCPMDNEPEARLKVAGTSTCMELLGVGEGGGKGKGGGEGEGGGVGEGGGGEGGGGGGEGDGGGGEGGGEGEGGGGGEWEGREERIGIRRRENCNTREHTATSLPYLAEVCHSTVGVLVPCQAGDEGEALVLGSDELTLCGATEQGEHGHMIIA